MNWGTLVRETYTELSQSSASTATLDNCKQALCEAILFNQRFGPFAWQQKLENLALTLDEADVPLPADFAGLSTDPYYVIGDSPLVRRKMEVKGLDEVLQSLTRLSDEYSNTFSSTPRLIAIDPIKKCFTLAPSPNNSNDYLEIRYMKQGMPPYSIFDGTNWVFKDPATHIVVTDNFTNEWFQEGRYLSKLRALYYLWSRWYGGTDAATTKAQTYLQQWTEELNRLNGENSKRYPVRKMRGYI